MTIKVEAVFQQALLLDAVERAELIEALFRSFDKIQDRRVNDHWAKEAEARIDAYEAGKIGTDSSDAVLQRISKR
jgi:putative addiction module component (TIGR02574 family)